MTDWILLWSGIPSAEFDQLLRDDRARREQHIRRWLPVYWRNPVPELEREFAWFAALEVAA